MSRHLNLCFPEWQGYAESNSVYHGALAVKKAIDAAQSFSLVEVPEHENLILENDIMGYSANLRQLKATSALVQQISPSTIFMIGGTCAAEIAPVSYLNQVYEGDMALIWLDAHGDLNTPETSPSKHFHGMPVRALIGESDPEILKYSFSNVRPEQIILAGTRDLDPAEQTFIQDNHLTVVLSEEIDSLQETVRSKGFQHAYIHIDLDVLNPDEFPHLLYPTPGGITVDSLHQVVKQIMNNSQVVGSSIVEFVPRDSTGIHVVKDLVKALGV